MNPQYIKIDNLLFFRNALYEALPILLGFTKNYFYVNFVRFLIKLLMLAVLIVGIYKAYNTHTMYYLYHGIALLLTLSFVKWYLTAYLSLLGVRYSMGQPIDFNSIFEDYSDSLLKLSLLWLYSLIPYILLLLLAISIAFKYSYLISYQNIMHASLIPNFVIIIFVICSSILFSIAGFISFSIATFSVPLVIIKKMGSLSSLTQALGAAITNLNLMLLCQWVYSDKFLITFNKNITLNLFGIFSYWTSPGKLLVRSMFFRDVFNLQNKAQVH